MVAAVKMEMEMGFAVVVKDNNRSMVLTVMAFWCQCRTNGIILVFVRRLLE